MIDGLKILNLSITSDLLLGNPLLVFPLPVDEASGEIIRQKRTAQYRGLGLVLKPDGVVQLHGSLHKCKNGGSHNFDDFFYSDLLNVVIDLHEKFGINPKKVILNNLEFGVNILLPYNPCKFIDDLITHRTDPFSIQKGQRKLIAEAFYQRYVVKIYNKGLQYGCDKRILRFEVKVLKMVHLKNLGIETLWDILIPEKLKKLGTELVRCFSELIFFDSSIQLKNIPVKHAKILQEGNNTKIWQKLKEEKGANWNKKKNQFRELVKKYGQRNYFQIEKLIQEKWDYLSDFNEKNVHVLTDFQNRLDGIAEPFGKAEKMLRNTQINISTKELNPIKPEMEKKRICLVTGLDISMQKDDSIFLCTAGLKYYKINHPAIWIDLNERLSQKWQNASEKNQLEEIAHSIRNEYYNPKNNTRKSIRKINEYPTLFDNMKLINPEKLRIAQLEVA